MCKSVLYLVTIAFHEIVIIFCHLPKKTPPPKKTRTVCQYNSILITKRVDLIKFKVAQGCFGEEIQAHSCNVYHYNEVIIVTHNYSLLINY